MRKPLAIATLTLAAAALTGCINPITFSEETDEPGVSTAAANGVASEAIAIATSMTIAQLVSTGGALAQVSATATCPDITVNTSQNGSWTSETLAFNPPACDFSGARGYSSMDVTGSVKLTRTAAGLSFNSNANNQQWAFGGYTETRNGTRDISATANSANVNSSMTIVYAGSSFNGQMVNALTANFSPASGSSIQADKPLPSGQFTYSGTVDFTLTDGDGGAFTVTTITPLAYNSACTNSDANLFDSGEVHVHYQPDDASASYAKVVWSNCGAPTVTYVAETPVAPTK